MPNSVDGRAVTSSAVVPARPIFQRRWLWVPTTGSPRRERRGVPVAGTHNHRLWDMGLAGTTADDVTNRIGHDYPRAEPKSPGLPRGSSQQLDRSRSRSLEPSVADGAEAIVESHHETIDVLLDIDGERRPGHGRREGYARRAEIEIIVFGEGRPVAGEGPLDPAAYGPSRWRGIRRCQRGAGDAAERVVVAHPSPAALGINQHRGRSGKADAPCDRGEPGDARIDSEQPRGIGVAPLHVRAFEHALDAHDPEAGLIIAADLAAADEPVRSMRAEIGPDHAGHRAGNVG